MSDAATGAPSGDAGQSNGEAQAQQGPDVGAINEQLQALSGGFEEMRDFLQSNPWQQPADDGAGAEPEPQQPHIDPDALTEYTYGDDEAARTLASVIENQWQQRENALRQEFQRELGNVSERVSERERLEQMRDLVDEFPDMANEDVARPIVQQAHELVAANGWPQQMATDPSFWRVVYAAQQAFAMHESEGRDGPAAAHLEGGSGGAGAASPQQRGEDLVKQIVSANGGGAGVLPFQ
jgi:hypothetical protein